MGDLRLTAPFFRQSELTARRQNRPTRHTSAGVLREFSGRAPDLPLRGLVFHLSRCGSTLVSQMLAAPPAHVVLSEAEPFDAVLRAGHWPEPVSATQRAGWLRGLVHAWGTRRHPDERRLFLKLECQHAFHFDLIRAAFPGVPCVFLYRDPVEILVSQGETFGGGIFSNPADGERIGATAAELSAMRPEEYCARLLGRVAEALADAAERAPDICVVAYPELPGAVESLIAPFLGLSLDEAEREQMRAVTRFHAKAPGQLLFREDSTRKQCEAEPETRALATRWMAPAHARLEAARRFMEKAAPGNPN